MTFPVVEHIEWPRSLDLSHARGSGPAALATAMVAWADGKVERLYGAFLTGNGHTQRAFLRRLSPEQVRELVVLARAHEKPLPHSTVQFTVWECNGELRRRGLAEA